MTSPRVDGSDRTVSVRIFQSQTSPVGPPVYYVVQTVTDKHGPFTSRAQALHVESELIHGGRA